MERILLMMAAARAADAEEALRSAAHNAVAPRRISYALSLLEEPSEMEIAALRRLGACQFLVPAADPWMDFQELWQGENYLLVGCPQMRFVHHWDLQLLRELRACQPGSDTPACVLTGYLPRPEDPVDAVCPVAVEGFDEGGRICFHRGTPLRYARQSQRCAFLHPRFCFGPAAFFQQVAHSQGPRFLAAFQQRWDLYTLRQALMHLTWDDPLPPCPVEGEERVLQRFEKRFGLRLDTRQLSPMARLGLISPELTFPTCVPLPVKWQEAVHRLLCRRLPRGPAGGPPTTQVREKTVRESGLNKEREHHEQKFFPKLRRRRRGHHRRLPRRGADEKARGPPHDSRRAGGHRRLRRPG